MRTRERGNRYDSITNQMMKGCNGKVQANNVAATDQEIEDFKRIYGDTISYLDENLPKSLSVAVCGAIGKAILWYGKSTMEPFVKGMATREFKGRRDPCFALWEWLIRYNKRNNTNEIYRRTITAIRIFLRGAEFKTHLRPALNDLFEWENNYRTMRQPRKNQHTVVDSSGSPIKQTDEAIMAEIEDLLGACPT